MTTQSMMPTTGFAIPDGRTIRNLAIGGIAGLFLWEIFARILTKAVLGYPLEPAGLIDAIAQNLFGLEVNYWIREALHYGVGILGYPIAFYLISRMVPRWSAVLDALIFVSFTAALGLHMSKNGFSLGLLGFWLVVVGLIASRFINKNIELADAITWGNFTWLNALAIMAPLGGLSVYLLGEGGDLSFMSFVGHVIYGAVAVIVFNRLQDRTA